ncbi:MAG: ADP-ribosylation factor-like protein [Candidatus Hodarchaeales archaeon]
MFIPVFFKRFRGVNLLLIRFSISSSGLELFSYETEKAQHMLMDPHLVAGFMDAIQMFSEAMGAPVQQMQLAGMMLYIRLLVEGKLADDEIEQYFEQLAKEANIILASRDQRARHLLSKDTFEARLLPIFKPLLHDPMAEIQLKDQLIEDPVSKIALFGLAKAGKTSIRNVFFENWTEEMAKETKPTISVDISRKFLEFLQTQLLIMDFGGQQVYRKQHLRTEERWKGVSSLIFVVDIQDPASYEDAKNYLSEVWELILKTNERKPRLSIFLHKYDIKKRKKLAQNVSECIASFKDFTDVAGFHPTTIEDSSSNIAMIKSLYFSLPNVMIRRILEEEFLSHFENVILPQFSVLGHNEDLLKDLKIDIRRSAEILGMTYSVGLQESWLRYLMGEATPKRRSLSHKSLAVIQSNQSLQVRIPHWPGDEIPEELTTVLLEGMLTGMLKTFHLEAPELIEDTGTYTTWKLKI